MLTTTLDHTTPSGRSRRASTGITSRWLSRHGITGTADELEVFVQHARDQLSLRVADRIMDELDDTQLDRLETIPESERPVWLDRLYPNYSRTVRQELRHIKQEIMRSSAPTALLASWPYGD